MAMDPLQLSYPQEIPCREDCCRQGDVYCFFWNVDRTGHDDRWVLTRDLGMGE